MGEFQLIKRKTCSMQQVEQAIKPYSLVTRQYPQTVPQYL